MSQAPRAKAFMVIAPFLLCAMTIVIYFAFATLIFTSPQVKLNEAIVASIVTLALRETLGVIMIMVTDIYRHGRLLAANDKDGDGKPDEEVK